MWVPMEIVAIATDLAEFIGAALGFNLLFDIPLSLAGLLTAVVTFLILALQSRGFGPGGGHHGPAGGHRLCYLVETFLDKPDWGQVAYHAVVPAIRRRRKRPAGHRHPGGHRHAPRDLSCTRR